MEPAELLPIAQATLEVRRENHSKDSPQARCLPVGVNYVRYVSPLSYRANSFDYRQVFTDGRSHPKDLDPTWYGHSIGKWEGDTLVVDTVGFNDENWLDSEGRGHTERLHVVERYRRPDLHHLEIEFTIEDPGAFAKPWVLKKVSDLTVNDEVSGWV